MKTKAEREVIEAALVEIAQSNDGVLTPDAVVAAAADSNSPLHGEFEWDSNKAAHAWRIDQARTLIRSVQIVITNSTTSVKTVAYVRDPDAEPNEQGYVSTRAVMGDEERARRVLVDEFKRAAAALGRARLLAAAFEMENEIDAVATTISMMQTKVVTGVKAVEPARPTVQ